MSMKDSIQPERSPILIGKVGVAPHDDVAAREWPVLMELLLPRFDAKGRMTRESGSISIRCEGSVFRVTITLPTDDAQTTLDLVELQDLFTLLELHVSSSKANWVQTWNSRKRARQRLDDVVKS